MRAGWVVPLALLGLVAGVPIHAEVATSQALIARCAGQADAGLRGLDALRSPCPGIEPALAQLGIEVFLPADWQQKLSPRALGDFQALAARYAGAPSAAAALRTTSRLRAIALSLRPPPSPASWWDALKAWIREWLEPADGRPPGWLRFLPHLTIGPRLARLIFVGLAALVVIAVAAVVLIELKAAGVGSGRRPRSGARRSRAAAAARLGESPDLAGLGSVPERERPILLLRALVQALARAHRLVRDRDLTCRELIAQARFDTPGERADFEHVALLAERALYGDPQTAPVIPEPVLRSARHLHEKLLAAP
jgi:hypothetical protein